jgi:hypothetical protein
MLLGAMCILWAALPTTTPGQTPTLLFSEGFENGWNGWTNDTTYNVDKRFAWVVGAPTNGPGTAHRGANCAATLDLGTDCYLVSPPLALPAVDQYSNHVWLFYWQWQRYSASYSCLSDVKIRQHQSSPMGDYWGPWNIIDPGTSGVIQGNSPVWRRRGIDLTLFSGGIVQLGFGHGGVGAPGWFVDDLEVWNVPVLTNWPGMEGFENGWGVWHTDEGVWDIGTPTGNGPPNVPDGQYCAGTALDGANPTVFEAHLWTPAFYLPAVKPGESAYLQFQVWYEDPNAFCLAIHWSQWWSSIGWTWPQTIDPDLLIVPVQRQWITMTRDLTPLAGLILPMRLGFEHANVFTNKLGAFIDNVEIRVAHFQLTELRRDGTGLRLTWSAPAGTTNVLQCSPGLTAPFTNASPALIASGSGEVLSTFTHAGAAGTSPLFYRVKRVH